MITNLYELLLDAGENEAETVFFIFGDVHVTYGEALDSVQRFARFLRESGIRRGDRILINIGNIPEYIYSVLGAHQVGAIPVPVNPAAKVHELRYYCEKTSPSIVITQSEYLKSFQENGGLLLPGVRFVLCDDTFPEKCFMRIIEVTEKLSVHETLNDEHPAVIIFTAAENGFPGGAMITHRAILESARLSRKILADRDDSFIAVLPLFHAFGILSALFLPLYNRAHIYLMERFSLRNIAGLLAAGEITVFCGVPVMFGALARVLEYSEGFSRVRAWVSGGEAVSLELQKLMKSKFNVELRQGYGLTEASPIVTWNTFDRPNRHGSIGTAMPYNEVKLVCHGREAGVEEEGEIIVKGVNVVPGYYNDPEKTSGTIRNGWLYTGDLAVRDTDGYFRIVGRKKKMILRNGFNVYPREVERLLGYHPGVEKVQVLGNVDLKTDFSGRDSLEAVVYGKSGTALNEKSFREWCADNISYYKVPDIIRFV